MQQKISAFFDKTYPSLNWAATSGRRRSAAQLTRAPSCTCTDTQIPLVRSWACNAMIFFFQHSMSCLPLPHSIWHFVSLCKNMRLNKWEKTPSKPLELQCFMNVAVLFQNNLVFFNVERNRGHLLLSALETTHQLLGLKKYFPNLIRSIWLGF